MYAIFLTADMCCELGKGALVSTLILIHPMDKSGDKWVDKSGDKYTTAKTCLKHFAPERVGGVPPLLEDRWSRDVISQNTSGFFPGRS